MHTSQKDGGSLHALAGLAAGQGGRHANGRLTHGNSMIVDPWGEVLDRKLKGPGVVLAELDHARLSHVRGKLPALAHRKL